MSREGLVSFVSRVMADESFRSQLQANPDATLAQFDLTAEEIAAIKSADRAKLEEAGVDERVTKTGSVWIPQPAIGVEAGSTTLYTVLSKIFAPLPR